MIRKTFRRARCTQRLTSRSRSACVPTFKISSGKIAPVVPSSTVRTQSTIAGVIQPYHLCDPTGTPPLSSSACRVHFRLAGASSSTPQHRAPPSAIMPADAPSPTPSTMPPPKRRANGGGSRNTKRRKADDSNDSGTEKGGARPAFGVGMVKGREDEWSEPADVKTKVS